MEKEYFVLYTPENMNKAFNLMDREYSQAEIFDILQSDDDIEKQICLIKLNNINSNIEAEKLVSVLTKQHGPVREICSAKINEFLKNSEKRQFFKGDYIREICLNALNDIIPTVARNILEVLKYLPQNEQVYICLLNRILDLKNYNEPEDPLSNHEIIKKTFKLYWYLEALAEFTENISTEDNFKYVIEYVYCHQDYTIREKAAKILSKINGFEEYKNILAKDDNPYVYNYLKNMI